jgi:type IV pilus assembly protein PilB
MPPVQNIDPAEFKGRKLGRVLSKMGKVSREQVHEALEIQKTRKVPIGQLLVELGYCTQKDVAAALAGQAGLAYVDIAGMEVPESVRTTIPAENVHAYQVVPIEYNPTSKRLKIAMKSADNFRAVDDLRLLMGFNVEAVVADPAAIDALIKKYYAKQESVVDVVSSLASDAKFKQLEGRGDSIDLDAVLEAASDNQVIKLINLVLLQAIKDRASDIHFEPFEAEFKMRYRIDGVLYEMVPPPKHLGPAITSRVKVMANLDIAERRLPQDGRIELTVGGNPVDLRVAILPTMHGESCVMRVLDRSNVELSLDRLGLREDDLAKVRGLIRRPNGIVIVTGPTGSGKTTTLYAALAELNDIETKILTAEDPVEYDIDGLCQCQVNEEVGLTFAKCLRSFLRQDPDIILVGENPRPRDGADRGAGIADGPPRAQHAPHQRCAELDHPLAGPGHGELPAHGHSGRDHRAASGAHGLPQVQGGVPAQGGGADGAEPPAGGCARAAVLPWQRVRQLQQVGVPRSLGDLRDHVHRR